MHGNEALADVTDTYEKLTEDELANVGIVLGAYRSFRGNRRAHIAYVSMPITSGRRLYEALQASGVKSVEELSAKEGKDALWRLVIKPNIDEGIALADRLGTVREQLFVAPSVFEAKRWRWSQDAYMTLWYRVIGEMAGSHYMMDGWEYSTGGLKEVLFSMCLQWRMIRRFRLQETIRLFELKNFCPGLTTQQETAELEAMWRIRVYDERGVELRIDDILSMTVRAVSELRDQGLPFQDLLGPAGSLKAIPILSPFGGMSEQYGVPAPTDKFWQAREALEKIIRETITH